VNGNREDAEGLERLQAALAARSTMKSWAEGAELIELVQATHHAGWLRQLRAETTADELAATNGVPVEQASNVLTVLTTAGVAQAKGASFRLSPTFDALVGGASGVDMAASLDAVELARSQARQAVQPTDHRRGLDNDQALVLARDWGVRPTPGARQVYELIYQALPEYRDRLQRGGPLLDVGSGVGGALITTLTLFDELRAVGVEIVPEIAAETRRRAQDAGVADRVEVRAIDARALNDESAFTVSYWAQPFFSADARAATLATIFRALQPGGLLLMQELFPPLTTQGEPSIRAQLDQLFYRQQNASFGLSAETLATETGEAGFQDAQIVASPLGRLVLVRRPAH
jgi:SAM-dependent methyltransferase